jgi:hypothetical protein
MMSGIGFQTKQTPNGSQFETSGDFRTFMAGTGATVNTYAVEGIITFWRDALKANAVSAIPIPALREEEEFEREADGSIKMDPTGNPIKHKIDKEYSYQFKPSGYVPRDKIDSIWSSLISPNYNLDYGFNPTGLPAPGIYDLNKSDNDTVFQNVSTTGTSIRFKSGPTYNCGKEYVKIESGGVGPKGFIEFLKDQLATRSPLDNDDNHALIINEIGTAMSAATTGIMGGSRPTGDRHFASMLRQTSIGRDKVQGLASTWNYIVGLPDLIQKRQNKAPGGVLEYKQKMILKSKGIELQKLLSKQYDYMDIMGQKQVVRLAHINKLSKEDFGIVLGLARTDLGLVGKCVAEIQQELDKDNSIVRKYFKDNPIDPFKGGPRSSIGL